MTRSTETVLIKEEIGSSSLVFLVEFPADYLYFQGHFPQISLLPAVAQIDFVMAKVHVFFGKDITMVEMPRVKFMKPIRPDKEILVNISINREKSTVEFSFSSEDKVEKYSSGKIKVGMFHG